MTITVSLIMTKCVTRLQAKTFESYLVNNNLTQNRRLGQETESNDSTF